MSAQQTARQRHARWQSGQCSSIPLDNGVRLQAVETARRARVFGHLIERRQEPRDHSLDALYTELRARLRAELRETLSVLHQVYDEQSL